MPKESTIQKVLIIGSGPIIIGQAAEFDYSGTQGCLALKEEGYEVILVNHNPATIMTDTTYADNVYCEPLTIKTLTAIIEKERPDGLVANLGGQTALNLAVGLDEKGILAKYGVKLLGTSVDSIQKGEDREKFRTLMNTLGHPTAESAIVHNLKEALVFAETISLPIIVRPAYTLGGRGGGIASTHEEYCKLVQTGLKASPITQVLVEKSIAGFKEIEYEVMRDSKGNCISVCNMENFDPVGVHTGDSIVVAPSQTLTDQEFHMLRTAAFDIISALEVVGGCNIQFALDPDSNQYYVIEVNPRVSRSSALASKATGYPIAKIAVKLAVGQTLDEIINPLTRTTFASFEPALDYVVVKFPRWPFDKFPEANRVLGTKMKATGEVMAIERSLEAAFQKALHSLDLSLESISDGLSQLSSEELFTKIATPTDLRFFELVELFRRGHTIEEIHAATKVDVLFLSILQHIVSMEKKLTGATLTPELLKEAKEYRFEDDMIGALTGNDAGSVHKLREEHGILPVFKMVDTCAGEFEAITNYAYSTYYGSNEIEPLQGEKKVLIIGAGPIRIGQGVEFDYSAVKAIQRLKAHGYTTIMVNNNPETVSTDYETADRLYFEPITEESVLSIIAHEQIDSVLVQFGGQTALNLAEILEEKGVSLLGTSSDIIDRVEDRERFYQFLDEWQIPRVKGDICHSKEEALQVAGHLAFPLLCRPSYVIGGKGMVKVQTPEEMQAFIQGAEKAYFPILIDEFKEGREVEIDLVGDGKTAYVPGVMEHIERAGVHSGDSMSIFPSESLSRAVKETIEDYAGKIVSGLQYKGIMNIQFLLQGEEVLVLEVNPRASRTVPVISKIIGYPLIDMATDLICDHQAAIYCFTPPTEIDLVGVKYPVFSSHALPEIDQILGANMKSTGEGLCLGETVEEALFKVFEEVHEGITAGGTIFVDSECADLKAYQTAGESSFYEWVESDHATVYYSQEETAEMKKRRMAALEAGITVLTEADTLKAFIRSADAPKVQPIPLAQSKTIQGVSRV
ncbi:carbamoyl phosphate synthase large subunit [Bacillus sp. KH172YL63]|uniref:carbamoyl phosphate synthase large subunit n=1 Tax=Bacillus sp. KH172YL63 TaxID=2709784 RepID=UPI0013E4B4CF|nr:carbamoyl phosphate synthase large subunit [Bacillus sp. KH172YL63]BCB02222.1 carbamoyl-phosphate synthase arginine-specific large chain [Bacillus sp. KH172YL63]